MPEVPSRNGPGAQRGAAEDLVRWTVAMPPARAAFVVAITVAIICSVIALCSSLQFAPARVAGAEGRLDGGSLARAWARWDSGWYASIAMEGYTYAPGGQSPVAFFPGYPLAIRTLASMGMDPFTAGFLVSLVCGIYAFWLFFRWAAVASGSKTTFPAPLMVIFYSLSCFLVGADYSDASFLLFVFGAVAL